MAYPGSGQTGTPDDLNAEREYKALPQHMNTVAGNEILVLDAVKRYAAPVLLSEIDNAKPFTLVAKVKAQFPATYDAGTLYIWAKDDLWLKLEVERDERAKIRVVSVRTEGTSDDNNHDVVGEEAVYLKISSDTKTVGFYYSKDQKSWQMVRLFKNGYPQELWIGVSAQSPMGEGTEATFEGLSLSQESIEDFRLGQ
ncbi:DUF1349 domain-containing protein [Asticcacaulis machinosus]|uniref:DUF1349 domain-containing protein n=1 Tax=Asticcacaulis machinosus TaxID=2984211 RepID=A0ABT5HF88_9CAUL|nr:DUF1349 domain-containing protein [Asticcacaulis machinosus]MDC7674923.1 DUF1349 domain-containing protein [Asticcacaulis machinosus]